MVSCAGASDARERERTRRGALARCGRGAARDPAPSGALSLFGLTSFLDTTSRARHTHKSARLMTRHGSGAHVTRSRAPVTLHHCAVPLTSGSGHTSLCCHVNIWQRPHITVLRLAYTLSPLQLYTSALLSSLMRLCVCALASASAAHAPLPARPHFCICFASASAFSPL